MINVLITGADGFVGRHLASRIQHSSDLDLVVQDRSAGDIAMAGTWATFPAAKVLVHLAAKTFVPDSWEDPIGVFQTNLIGTINALEYCRVHSAKLIFLSSYLYGPMQSLPISEDALLHASNPYMLSKMSAEDICRLYVECHGTEVIILRPFNIYGVGQDKKFLIPSMVHGALTSGKIVVNDLDPKRDYIYIDDVVNAIIAAIYSVRRTGTYNIASGKSFSVKMIIEMIATIMGKSVEVKSRKIRRPNEVMETRGDITRAYEELGWEPVWSVRAGLEALIVNMRNEQSLDI